MGIVEIENLNKVYEVKGKGGIFSKKRESRSVKALDDINLKIEKGEILGLIGANGAGKSTLIKIMTGILRPSGGKVELFGGNPMSNRKKNSKRIGVMMGQRTQLWWDIPAKDSFELYRRMYSISKEEYRRKIDILHDMLDIGDFMDRPVRKLSLGQRMKCELGVSLLHSPELLFLDEPTIGVDIVAKEKILQFIKDSNQEFGTSIILTTHDIFDIEKSAKNVMVISRGKSIFQGSMEELKRNKGNVKLINVELQRDEKINIQRGADRVKQIGDRTFQIKVDCSRETSASAIKEIVSKNAVADISISEESIESVVKRLYVS